MATPDQLKTQADQTHLGLLSQSVDYSKKLIDQRQAEATKLENEFNSIDRAGPRSAYLTAKNDPNADPAQVAELKSKYDAVKEYSADVSARLGEKNRLLEDTQKGLVTNQARYEEAKALAPAGASNNTPTAGATSNDPVQSVTQNRVDTANTVPPGNQLNSDKTSVNSNTEGLPVQAEDGSLATSKRNPEGGELYNPVPPPTTSGLSIRNEDGSFATSRINPETGQLYNPVAGSVAEGELSAVPDPQKTPISDTNNGGEGFGTITQDENGGFVNADGNPVDANGMLIPPIAPQKTIADVNNGGEGFGDIRQDENGGFVNADGQPVDANGMLIPPSDKSVYDGAQAASPNTTSGVGAARLSAAKQAQKFEQKKDWRVRLSLAPDASYLYKAPPDSVNDILAPLRATDGVIFPYTPTINTSYRANYDPSEVTHSNYKLHFYKNSSVDDVSITAEFTAQDTVEANYMLAVIHFFKSVTKMFYGQDKDPRAGTPPPLVYLSGYGAYQFDNHPLVVTQFTYNLPNDVDYIRAGSVNTWGGSSVEAYGNKSNAYVPALNRLFGSGLSKGGVKPKPAFGVNLATQDATYVPTKISLTINMAPMVTRNDISKNFSLRDYATGALLRGSQRNGGGIW
jgi:hypothetical protein